MALQEVRKDICPIRSLLRWRKLEKNKTMESMAKKMHQSVVAKAACAIWHYKIAIL
jgi:hypothetical protein